MELSHWSKWLDRLSGSFVAATGLRAAPQVEILRGSSAQPVQACGRPVRLSDDELLRVRHAGAAEVRALQGQVWVTQDGDLRDIVLQAGESFRFDRDSPVLIAPFGSAQVMLTAEARPGSPC